MELTSKLLTDDTWNDFEALFTRFHGVYGGCWCVYHRMTMSTYIGMKPAERYDLHKKLVADGKATGLIVYHDGIPSAWCQFGRADTLGHYDKMKAYKALNMSGRAAWRITCFFIDPELRNKGVATYALAQVLITIKAHGGGIVEAFPGVLSPGERPTYQGSMSMYEKNGFELVAPLGDKQIIMRKVV